MQRTHLTHVPAIVDRIVIKQVKLFARGMPISTLDRHPTEQIIIKINSNLGGKLNVSYLGILFTNQAALQSNKLFAWWEGC